MLLYILYTVRASESPGRRSKDDLLSAETGTGTGTGAGVGVEVGLVLGGVLLISLFGGRMGRGGVSGGVVK